MKILCLHGFGSSGAIFEAQMANLQQELDPSIELIFVDGPFECERGPGVPSWQSGPFFSHTQGYSPVLVAQAVDYLEEILEQDGPFDGIFGFSQGAALTLSYFYKQQAVASPVQVRFACLFSTAMPLSPDTGLGNTVIAKLRALEYDITDRTKPNSATLTTAEQEFVSVLQQTIVDAAIHDSPLPWIDLNIYRYGEREAIPRVMCPSLLTHKIDVPTIHVWGLNDVKYMIKMAELGRSICDNSMARTVLHEGLHDIPQKQSEIKAVLRSMNWVMV